MSKLTVAQVVCKLQTVNINNLIKPGKNKGERGQLLENILGIDSSSNLKDLEDGDLKTFTQGETISITLLKHCLDDIIFNNVEFEKSVLGSKLTQIIFVGFSRNNQYLGYSVVNLDLDPSLFLLIKEDYHDISDYIRKAFDNKEQLNTFNGRNKLLQIRTKASKSKNGIYPKLIYNNHTFKDKYMGFYLLSSFGKNLM